MIIVPDKKKAEEVICLDDSDEDTPLAKMRTPEKDKTRDTKKGIPIIHVCFQCSGKFFTLKNCMLKVRNISSVRGPLLY